MSANAGISYRVQQLGLEGVRDRLREINGELKAGAPATKEMTREIRELSTGITTQNRVVNLNRQAWQQQHTSLMATGRVMSAVGSAARSALAVTTAWSVAIMAFGKTSDALADARKRLGDLTVLWDESMKSISEGKIVSGMKELREEIVKTEKEIKDLEWKELEGQITAVVNAFATFAIMGSHTMQMIIKLRPQVALLRTEMIALSPAVTAASTSLTGFGAALSVASSALAVIGGFFLGTELRDANRSWLETIQNDWHNFVNGQIVLGNDWIGHLTIDLPAAFEATRLAFLNLWVGMISITNAAGMAIVGGINSAVSAVVNAVNTIIRSINSAAGFTGISIPTIGFSPAAFTAIPTISAATGFSGQLSRDTTFLAHRGEDVRITPASQSSRGGGGGVTIIIQGDVTGEEVVNKVRRAIRDNLRYDQGFTGF